MENSEDEYETEEAVVLVELNGIIDPNFLTQQQTPTKLLGFETEKPILQIGHYVFSGEYEDTLGTVVVYEPHETTDEEGIKQEQFKFLCKTDKKLSMQRIFLQEKAKVETPKQDISSASSEPMDSAEGK